MIVKKQIAQPTELTDLSWTQLDSERLNQNSTCCVTSTGRIIVGTAGDGVQYSDNGGETWVQSSISEGKWAGLCITPTGRVIICNAVNTGIWYSDDNGVNWVQSNKTSGFGRYSCVTPTGRIIVAGESFAISYSDDDGVNWHPISIMDSLRSVQCICVTSTGRIIAGTFDGVWYSDDNGETWVHSDLVQGTVKAFCITSTGRIILSHDNTYGKYCIMRSDNNGETWVEIQTAYTQIKSFICSCVTPTGKIIIGSPGRAGVWYSDDDGITWVRLDVTEGIFDTLCITPVGRIIATGRLYDPKKGYTNVATWYADLIPLELDYTSKLLTGEQAKELVRQCKAYVQAKKAEQQNNG